MVLRTSDNRVIVDVGSHVLWDALKNTVEARLDYLMDSIKDAWSLLNESIPDYDKALETARQINLIRDGLSRLTPDQVVYDKNKTSSNKANISAVVTSCGNYFTTADGKDLLAELVGLLTYSAYFRTRIEICD